MLSIISSLKPVDLTTVAEPCAILYVFSDLPHREGHPLGAFAWFPEPRNELMRVSNPHLTSADYLFITSSKGRLCGVDICTFDSRDPSVCELRLAVCEPATGRLVELPLLEPHTGDGISYVAFEHGNLRVSMDTSADGTYSVHVLLYRHLSYVVYTYLSTTRKWVRGPVSETEADHPRGRDKRLAGDLAIRLLNLYAYDTKASRWSSVSCPGSAWNDYPMPPELVAKGYSYVLLHPFFYGSRLVMAGVCRAKAEDKVDHAMILEQKDDASWDIVAVTPCFDSRTDLMDHFPEFDYRVPRLFGCLLIFPSHYFRSPVAFHLEKGTWLKLPQPAVNLPFQLLGFYEPRQVSPAAGAESLGSSMGL